MMGTHAQTYGPQRMGSNDCQITCKTARAQSERCQGQVVFWQKTVPRVQYGMPGKQVEESSKGGWINWCKLLQKDIDKIFLIPLWTWMIMRSTVKCYCPQTGSNKEGNEVTITTPASGPISMISAPLDCNFLSVVSQRIGYKRVHTYMQVSLSSLMKLRLLLYLMLRETLSAWTLNFDWGRNENVTGIAPGTSEEVRGSVSQLWESHPGICGSPVLSWWTPLVIALGRG